MVTPQGQAFVHLRYKAVIVMAFQEVHQFMDDDVLKALDRLLNQFKVQPNPPRFYTAGPPFGFHALDATIWSGHVQLAGPTYDNRYG